MRSTAAPNAIAQRPQVGGRISRALTILHSLSVGCAGSAGRLMALGLVAFALIIATAARECRTGRLILNANIHPESLIQVDLVYSSETGNERIPIYHGDAGFRGPRLFPFRFGGDGHFDVKVVFPDGRELTEERGYVSGIGMTFYIFIGEHEVLYANSSSGYFYVSDEHSLRDFFATAGFYLSDILSCAI